MARFLFNGHGSSFTARFNLFVLIALVLVCFCSYCSSSSLVSPIFDVDSSADDIDDEINYYSPTHRFLHVPQPAIYPTRNPFRNILLKSLVIQPSYRQQADSNKRYASQAFHAMRG